MGLTRKAAIKVIGGSGLAAAGVVAAGETATAAPPVLRRDVCVLGGGSSGTYAAVRLRDLGHSVVVLERSERLGGHTETYTDPVTGETVDIGVVVFHDIPTVRDYCARLGVPLTGASFPAGDTAYVDYRTGLVVDGYTPPVPTALPDYLALLERYPYLDDGYQLPDPVPAELLRPFGDVVRAYGLDSVVTLVFNFGQGIGDLLRMPALYAFKLVGLSVVNSVLTNSFVAVPNQDNSLIYQRATALLGDDVLFGAQLRSVDRGGPGPVELLVSTPDGDRLVRCDRLVVAVPPEPDGALLPFDLDGAERSLFARFKARHYSTGVLRLAGLPAGLGVTNVGADTPYHLPPLPAPYGVSPAGPPGLWNVKYGAPVPLDDRWVRADIAARIRLWRAAGTFPDVDIVGLETFSDHRPFELAVTPADLAGGFYRRLYALQGTHRTYWTGAAFHCHNSSLLWRFTEALLPLVTS